MKKYEVEVTLSTRAYVEVWAKDEKDARTIAEGAVCSGGDYDNSYDINATNCDELDETITEEFLRQWLLDDTDLQTYYDYFEQKYGCSESYESIIGNVLYSITELGYDDVFSSSVSEFSNAKEIKDGLYFDLDYALDEMREWMSNYETK